MKINSRVFQKRFVVSILVSLIVPMGVWECCALSLNSENFIAKGIEMGNSFLTNTKFPKNSLITPLSAKYNEKEYIEYYQSNFTTGSNKDTLDAVVIFNDDIEWNFPDLTISYRYKYLNGFKANLPLEMYNHLKQSGFTKYVYKQHEFNVTLDSNDDLHWGVDHTEAEVVWGGAENAKDVLPGNPAGAGVKVAVMDTGIAYNHTDLDDNYKGGYDFAGDGKYHPPDDDPMDYWRYESMEYGSHGTHVAGIIAAEDNGQDVIGVAPEASLYALKVFCKYVDPHTGYAYDLAKNLDQAMEWAINNEMDIVSMSLGESFDWFDENHPDFLDLCDIAYEAGIVLVGSAGNDASSDDHYPAALSRVIQVGAVDRWDNLASYSNYGDNQELVAPGGGDSKINWIKSTKLGGGTFKKKGTSQAVPMVSGVCALLLSAYPHLTPDEVRYILRESADDLGEFGKDLYYGYGMVNAEAALTLAAALHQPPVFYEDGDGMTNSWQASDTPYNVIVPDHNYDDYCCVKNYEATSHVGYKMWAESPAIDLSSWAGANDLLLTFRFRCKSSCSSSSVTQFRLRFYDTQTSSDVDFTNPTTYSYYIVKQNNRNGQTWLSGYDSGWQTVSFTLLASEFSLFAGSNNRLVLRWGHHDSWGTNHGQREYLDYLQIMEDDNAVVPNPPRELIGFGDGIAYITLTWKSPANILATKYRIYRQVDSVYVLQATVDHSGFLDTTQLWIDPEQLTPFVTYYYRVRAYNNGIAGAYAYWSGDVGWQW